MDPDACLKNIRNLINDIQDGGNEFDIHYLASLADSLADNFSALDNWLTNSKGYLPNDWRR